jgi:4-hydroxythreonine-4-phosphate dehydrogenase
LGGAEIIPFSVYAGRPRSPGAHHFDAEDEL